MNQKDSGDFEVGERIKKARDLNGVSQTRLAELCGWKNRTRISYYENGKRMPSINNIKMIASVLRVSREWLVFGVGDTLNG